MISSLRQQFNLEFSQEKNHQYQYGVHRAFRQKADFNLLETPLFISKELAQKLKAASFSIIDQLQKSTYRDVANQAILDFQHVPNEDKHPIFLQFDFALTKNKKGEISPQLIELQGFPTLFFFQIAAHNELQKHYSLDNTTAYYDHLSQKEYLNILRENILGRHQPHEVILLEYKPWQQKTAIDFAGANQVLGIPIIDIRYLQRETKQLFYFDKHRKKIKIKRIFNRVILDELDRHAALHLPFNLRQKVDVEWAGHPNWFLKYSKFSLPYIQGDFSPKALFLDQWNGDEKKLRAQVLKPIFSFSGNGVHLNPTKEIINNIRNKSQYILQDKVSYAPILLAPNRPSQIEVRVTLLQKPNKKGEYQLMTNLIRAGQEGLINTRHNNQPNWTGGGIGLMER